MLHHPRGETIIIVASPNYLVCILYLISFFLMETSVITPAVDIDTPGIEVFVSTATMDRATDTTMEDKSIAVSGENTSTAPNAICTTYLRSEPEDGFVEDTDAPIYYGCQSLQKNDTLDSYEKVPNSSDITTEPVVINDILNNDTVISQVINVKTLVVEIEGKLTEEECISEGEPRNHTVTLPMSMSYGSVLEFLSQW